MNVFLSNKIRYMSFLSILLVIYIHSYYLEGNDFEMNKFIQLFWGQGICRIAVPLFFIISGYLFFCNVDEGVRTVWRKIKKRRKTLLLPYILANIVFVSVFILMHYIPQTEQFVNSPVVESLKDGSIWGNFKELFWLPVGFHLWFLRDLILVILSTPILYYLLKYIPWITVVVLFLISMIIPSIADHLFAWAWFTTGACLAVTRTSLFSFEYNYSGYICACGLLFLFLDSVCIGLGVDIPFVFHFAGVVSGVVGIWLLYDFVVKRPVIKGKLLNEVTQYTFFIYLFHEPALNVLKKLPPFLFGQSQWIYLSCYFIVPWLMLVSAIWVGKQLKRFTPRLYNLLTGGR